MKTTEKKILSNVIYTIGGSVLLNGVLQLIVNPLLNRYMGSDQMGVMLYITGLAAIICPSIGQALNNSRLVMRRSYPVTNGDYDVLLLGFGGFGTVITLIIARNSVNSTGSMLLTAVLLMVTVFRYYGDVEYRLSLNYKRYFYYYAILSVGYIAGFGIYMLTEQWFFVYILGEILALAYLAFTGTVFRNFFSCSRYFFKAFQRGGCLVCSYLINNFTLNMDRVVIKNLIGNVAVTQYYVVSLIGKTLVILVAPINTIMISYLTKKKETLNRKQFLGLSVIGIAAGVLFFFFAGVFTPIFIKIFYGQEMYQSVRHLIAIVNVSQILSMLSAYLFMIVLTFTKEKWQLIIQGLHMLIMVVLVLISTGKYGIIGFAVASLISNALRVLMVLILGLMNVRTKC